MTSHGPLGFAFVMLALVSVNAAAATAIDDNGSMVCAIDKWDERELEKGHKVAESASRCVMLPADPKAEKVTEACAGKYEFMADGSWKATGTCTDTHPGGDKIFLNWEEGSHLKQYTYTKTGGTGKYEGVRGSGTYMYENLTDTLSAGHYTGTLQLSSEPSRGQ